jgi:hypothetical protein
MELVSAEAGAACKLAHSTKTCLETGHRSETDTLCCQKHLRYSFQPGGQKD